ncbi:hypothetical protein GCM10018790_81180 [Kitasatospora xanthocidica]|nr:hypothetical protein [Kitasatospora xanthocidica]GHF91822.1 hypothetical protein GCM10018790_81180 [Kitasatospora xanthocidica]
MSSEKKQFALPQSAWEIIQRIITSVAVKLMVDEIEQIADESERD